jgi:glycosyltransferase involved in cell wall biosynthesis
MTKLISIVTPCYNEELNVEELAARIAAVMAAQPYDYEHIIIDNHSTDGTVAKVRQLIEGDSHIRMIVNARNFGHIRSPYHAILESQGDATILIAADLQDPPEIIAEFIKKWEEGYKTVMAVKPASEEAKLMFFLRKTYYKWVTRISEIPLVPNATGAGLFDKAVVAVMRRIDDPYPYFRGLVCEIGFPIATVPFKQPRRLRGLTKNNFYSLYDNGMLGVVAHSKVPLRLMTMLGFGMAVISFLVAIGFLVAKLAFWNSFELGVAPLLIGMFFLASIQLFFMGLLGEYVGMIYTRVRKLPLVTESERVNF